MHDLLNTALQQLLTDLGEVAELHREIFDTDVREQMFEVLYRKVVRPESDFTVPEVFDMFSPAADQLIQQALERYVERVVPVADALHLTPEQRMDAVQDLVVVSARGHTSERFFGRVQALAEYETRIGLLS